MICLLSAACVGFIGCAAEVDDDQELGSAQDALSAGAPTVGTVAATSVGTTSMTANGRIHPHGLPTTYFVEYGPTTGYGNATDLRSLPPKLAAFYKESWDHGSGGWFGGIQRGDLSPQASGGAPSGFVRYTDPQNSGDDAHHLEGIGMIHLAQCIYTGTLKGTHYPPNEPPVPIPSLFLGGGDPDLRGARVRVRLRGQSWRGKGTELVFWSVSDSNLIQQGFTDFRQANWALTGFPLSDHLVSGEWEQAEYRLENDSHRWSYAGRNGTRPNYEYWPLDESLAHVNADIFHNLVYVNFVDEPSGSIDFDELEIAYRNHSLLLPSNGGKLLSSPRGPSDVTALTDGWRHGPGRTWRSGLNPEGPLELRYGFATPVKLSAVQVHQNPEWPTREIEVLVSEDGASWIPLTLDGQTQWTLPRESLHGPNHAFVVARKCDGSGAPTALYDQPVRQIRVRLLSGYESRAWGLGEIEVFGDGAVMGTDDDWYGVSQDVDGLTPGQTYHYRIVAMNSEGTVPGPDMTFEVPTGEVPEVITGPARPATGSSVKVEGRLNPLGRPTWYYFEYGEDSEYGRKAPGAFPCCAYPAGRGETPRTVSYELSGLVPGTTYHYRLVAADHYGQTFGADSTFVAP